MELIKITERNGNQVVSARELHYFLESKQDFSNWIKNRIEKYGFIENVDFQSFNKIIEREVGATNRIEYALSIDCAKEISMVEGNDKGKQARRYFIECEKIAKNPIAQLTKKDLAKMLLESEEEKERLEATVQLQKEEIKESAPKAIYYDEVLQSKATYNTNLIAKELGMSAITLNRILSDLRIQYKQNSVWILYEKHQNKGYTKTKTFMYTDGNGNQKTSMQTVWTETGRKFIHDLINSKSMC